MNTNNENESILKDLTAQEAIDLEIYPIQESLSDGYVKVPGTIGLYTLPSDLEESIRILRKYDPEYKG